MGAIFEKLSASKPGYGFRPDTDSQSRVLLQDDESDSSMSLQLRCINSAFQTRSKPGQWIGTFRETMTEAQHREANWEITFTPTRFIVWSPLSVGLMGGMKAKPGSATGGHILYSWIDEILLGTTHSNLPGITFLFDANPQDAYYLIQLAEINFWNTDDAAKIATVLADRITEFWKKEDVDTPELAAELDKLRNYKWDGRETELKLYKAGAKVKYLPG